MVVPAGMGRVAKTPRPGMGCQSMGTAVVLWRCFRDWRGGHRCGVGVVVDVGVYSRGVPLGVSESRIKGAVRWRGTASSLVLSSVAVEVWLLFLGVMWCFWTDFGMLFGKDWVRRDMMDMKWTEI